MLMGRKQRCVTVMLNKCRYTSDIAVFDMFAVFLPKTFDFFQDHDTTRWSYAVNETLRYFSTQWLSPSSVISPC